jgi:hypothetical protein
MDPKIIAVLVLMMCCCSSSVGAFFMIPGEAATGPTGPTGPTGGGTYTYDFIINKAVEHASLGSHITDIRVDGVRVKPSEITVHVTPDHSKCNSKGGGYECEDDNFGLNDPEPSSSGLTDLTWTAWKKETETVGTKMFTITTQSKVTEFEIDHFRPLYQPGYIIKENGTTVVTETTNGGSEMVPNPKTVKYTIQ